MNFDSRFMSEGQFSHKQKSVKRQQHTKEIQDFVQNFWRYRLDFELPVVVYKDPRKRNNTYLNEVFNPLRNKSEDV